MGRNTPTRIRKAALEIAEPDAMARGVFGVAGDKTAPHCAMGWLREFGGNEHDDVDGATWLAVVRFNDDPHHSPAEVASMLLGLAELA